MKKTKQSFSFLLLLFSAAVNAQSIDVGFNVQYSALRPKIRLEQTSLLDYANQSSQTIDALKKQISKTVFSPSFGLSADGYFPSFPAFARIELSTSKSAIQYLSGSAEIGIGQDFDLIDGENFVTAKVGYKLTYDRGFGKPTIINSIKTANKQQEVEPHLKKKEFNRMAGKIIPIKVGIGHNFNGLKIGAEIQVNIDVTSIVSTAKMNSLSVGIYVKRQKSLTKKRYQNDL